MTNKSPKIVFMGNAEFSVPALELLNNEFGICLVVTNPDRPAGRGKKPTPTQVKTKAIELNIPVLCPEKLKEPELLKQLEEISPDIIVVIAFKILPREVFSKAQIASFNVHPSLLPKYRGPAPINWTIINGENETGLTTFILQEEVDAGNIILQWRYTIPDGFTAVDLHDFLAPKAGEIAVETCKILLNGNYQLKKQEDSLATKAPKIYPEQCEIQWNKRARELRNFIHGVSPSPGAWTILEGKRFKIYRCEYKEKNHNYELGKIIISKNEMMFTCLDGFILPKEVQIEGRKKMQVEEFLRGYRFGC